MKFEKKENFYDHIEMYEFFIFIRKWEHRLRFGF